MALRAADLLNKHRQSSAVASLKGTARLYVPSLLLVPLNRSFVLLLFCVVLFHFATNYFRKNNNAALCCIFRQPARWKVEEKQLWPEQETCVRLQVSLRLFGKKKMKEKKKRRKYSYLFLGVTTVILFCID